MGWIKFEKDLLTDPRVLRIAKALESRWNLDEETVRGKDFAICNSPAFPAVTLVSGALIRIWCLADTHIDPDDVLPLGMIELDEVVGIPGFCQLLPSDWLIPIDDNNVKLPGYHIHNGTEAKKKALVQRRVQRFRERNATPLPDKTKTKTKTIKEETLVAPLALPDWLDAPQWQAYVKTRPAKARKPESLKVALQKLAKFKAEGFDPNQIVAESLANGWQGLFEPKSAGGKGKGNGAWWTSEATIKAKGEELGLHPRGGETWQQFRGRIEVALRADE